VGLRGTCLGIEAVVGQFASIDGVRMVTGAVYPITERTALLDNEAIVVLYPTFVGKRDASVRDGVDIGVAKIFFDQHGLARVGGLFGRYHQVDGTDARQFLAEIGGEKAFVRRVQA
jgi:hypothetical protein